MAVGSTERGHYADDHRRDHDSVSLFRAQGEEPMSVADFLTGAPSREPARQHQYDARRHLRAAARGRALNLSRAPLVVDGDDDRSSRSTK